MMKVYSLLYTHIFTHIDKTTTDFRNFRGCRYPYLYSCKFRHYIRILSFMWAAEPHFYTFMQLLKTFNIKSYSFSFLDFKTNFNAIETQRIFKNVRHIWKMFGKFKKSS